MRIRWSTLSYVCRLLLFASVVIGSGSAMGLVQGNPEQGTGGETVEVELRVTAVIGGMLYLDRGSDDGLAPGDDVDFFPTGEARRSGRILSVAKRSARAEIIGSGAGSDLPIGTRGLARVPAARLGSSEGATPLPWTSQEGNWDPDRPLLADLPVTKAEERESRWRGRWTSRFDLQSSSEPGSTRYFQGRTGLDLSASNPFGRGGEFQFDGELQVREFDTGDGGDDDTTRAQVDRLSYAWGGGRQDARGFEVGRFLQSGMPEFGVLDGVEGSLRLSETSVFGASLGFMPEVFAGRDPTDNLQIAASYRREARELDDLSWGVGLQKTWDSGESDRDLIVLRAQQRPSERWSWSVSSWIDHYGSSEAVKDAGFELTELHGHLSWRGEEGAGASLNVSRLRWPDLLRREFPSLLAQDLADTEVTRLGLSVWVPASERVQVHARADAWEDEDRSGGGGEVGASVRGVLGETSRLGASVFVQDSPFSSFLGARFHADRWTSAGAFGLAYEWTEFDQDGFLASQGELTHQVLRGSWSHSFGEHWSASLDVDERFGDQQASQSISFSVQLGF